MNQEYNSQIFRNLRDLELETAKKGPHKLTYVSWAEAWSALKSKHPTSNFLVHENETGMPLFYDSNNPDMGGFVKVTVTVLDVSHTVHLPIMDYSNKSIPVNKITTFDVNKNIQRALTKAIALHGVGLYVFKGEDYPEDKKSDEFKSPETKLSQETKSKTESKITPQTEGVDVKVVKCIRCKEDLSAAEVKYTREHYKIDFCFNCQQLYKQQKIDGHGNDIEEMMDDEKDKKSN